MTAEDRAVLLPAHRVEPSLLVASDGSGLVGGADPGVVLSLLHSQALLIREHGGVEVARHAVTAADAAQLAAALRSLAPETSAIFLTRTEPERARAVQREFAAVGGAAVVTDHDAAAIAVTAAVLSTLTQVGRTPGESQVVIAGAQTLPVLPPLLMAAGVADILSWNQADAIGFPLASVAREATAVVDLLGAAPTTLTPAFGDTPVPVIAPDEVTALVTAAGLLRALAETRAPGFGSDPYHDVRVYLACAQALARCTAPGQRWPYLLDAGVTPAVTRAAARVLTNLRELQ